MVMVVRASGAGAGAGVARPSVRAALSGVARRKVDLCGGRPQAVLRAARPRVVLRADWPLPLTNIRRRS
jgi:hypothetical protein